MVYKFEGGKMLPNPNPNKKSKTSNAHISITRGDKSILKKVAYDSGGTLQMSLGVHFRGVCDS